MRTLRTLLVIAVLVSYGALGTAEGTVRGRGSSLADRLAAAAARQEAAVIEWRRDIHRNPELGNREFRTAALVARHLRAIGLEVRTGIAHTGVVGILRGGRPGRVVALRADMDALPVKELAGVPYASRARAEYDGAEVDVAHACGHDAHTAILMGAASTLAAVRGDLPGTVVFLFQPSEDSRPAGEEGGAALMIREGALDGPRPDAVFGLHVGPLPFGAIACREGGFMAAVSAFSAVIKGRGTHGAMPWLGLDPIPVTAQAIASLQTIVSRQVDLTRAPAVVTVGTVHAGTQPNIVPAEARFGGTIRTFSDETRKDVERRLDTLVRSTAAAGGAEAEVRFTEGTPPVVNDPRLLALVGPALDGAAGPGGRMTIPPLTAGEDFAFYQEKVPGVFFFLGTASRDGSSAQAAPNHSPYFTVDDGALVYGVKALAGCAAEFLAKEKGGRQDGHRAGG